VHFDTEIKDRGEFRDWIQFLYSGEREEQEVLDDEMRVWYCMSENYALLFEHDSRYIRRVSPATTEAELPEAINEDTPIRCPSEMLVRRMWAGTGSM
jgi:hypothetical protein